MAIQLRSKCRIAEKPYFVHLFSSSSNRDPAEQSPETTAGNTINTGDSQSLISWYFSDVKSSLKHKQPTSQSPARNFTNPSFSPTKPSTVASFEEIRKNRSDEQNGNVEMDGGKLSFESIRESMRQFRQSGTATHSQRKVSVSLSSFKESLRLELGDSKSGSVIGRTETLPLSVFGKEIKERKEGGERSAASKTEFMKIYNYGELGEKLKTLRPEKAAKGKEGNERLMKLREMEGKETESNIGGISFKDLRDSLVKLLMTDDEKTKKTSR